MGFFDRFKKAPPPPAAPASSPSTPFNARIATFNAADAVGTLAAADGSTVRFGRSACKGFEPVIGAEVVVNVVAPHPLGGMRANEVVLDPKSSSYDALLARRDEALGAKPPLDAVGSAAAACMVLGWIVVLLDDIPPSGPQAFAKWAAGLGLEKHGVRVSTDGEVRFGFGQRDVITYVGSGPFPRAKLDELGVPEDFDEGRGFIGLSLGLPNGVPSMRLVGNPRDPWAMDGPLRDLSRIVLALLEHAHAVILPQAGSVVPAQRFAQRLGDLTDADARPFGAWTAWAYDPERKRYATFGMQLHGLPDVETALTDGDDWTLDRACEALLFACQRMVFANAPLTDETIVDVPVGAKVGAHAIDTTNADIERYVVHVPGAAEALKTPEVQRNVATTAGVISLVREGPAEGVRALWRTTGKMTFPSYRELFLTRFARHFDATFETQLTPEIPHGRPPLEVDVLASNDGSGFLLVTNGVARVAQPGGARELHTAHVEIVAAMGDHHPLLASVLATVGAQVHAQGGDNPFKAGDTVGFSVEELGCAGFVLRSAGQLLLVEGGAPIDLLELIPLKAAEYETVRSRGSGPWLASQPPMTPASRAARWKLRLN